MSDFFGLPTSEMGPEFVEGEGGEVPVDMNESLDIDIDDGLDVVERVKKYVKSDLVLHRLYIVRELSDAVRSVGFEVAKEKFIPAMEDVLRDIEPVVRQALVEQIPEVSKFFKSTGAEPGYTVVLHILLPMVAELTTDRNAQVRSAAVESLEIMARIIRHEDLEPYLLPIIKSLANDSTEEEHRVEAAMLLHNMAPIFGAELCVQVVLPYVLRLADDPVFRVRKTVAANMGNICRTVGVETTTQHLLPIFLTLVSDEIWGVRKGCAESLVAMAEMVSPIERYSNLIEAFEKLAEDSSRWVRSAVFQNLGPFISTFEGHQVTPKLLRYYTGMVTDATSTKYADSDTVTYCAFSFPAVLQVVGVARWTELSDTYFTLVNDLQWKVRRTLSHSLHEIAKILGPALTENSLLPAFDLFLKDLDEVRVGVIRNIASFLEVVPMQTRDRYLAVLFDIAMDGTNWRFRKLLAKQMGKIGEIYGIDVVVKSIIPLSLSLLKDTVHTVRKATAKGISPLVKRLLLCDREKEREKLMESLLGLATENTYSMRQLYAQLCGYLHDNLPPDLFSHFLPPLLQLSSDPVPNVRYVTAIVLAKHLTQEHPQQIPQEQQKQQQQSHEEEIQTALARLRTDGDRDVSFVANTNNNEDNNDNNNNNSSSNNNNSNNNNNNNNNDNN